MLGSLESRPPDKIIALIQEFKDDPRERKVDLGVGVYRDASGNTPIMRAVKSAEKTLWERETTKAYTSMAGDPVYLRSMTDLVLGGAIEKDRIAAVTTPGGTGAVRQALELFKVASPNSTVHISSPSWPNHNTMARHLSFRVREYSYFDSDTKGVAFEQMLSDLGKAEPGDAVILHGCCHNPTGANLDLLQWQALVELLIERKLLPIMDIAYQGFGDGLEEDAAGLRILADQCPETLIAASCSKNFGIYRERTGILFAVAPDKATRDLTQSNLAHINRQNFSFPPDHGSRLVTIVLQDEQLRADWESEVADIRTGMQQLRTQLVQELRRRSNSDRFAFLKAHKGMFSLLGATPEQVAFMRREKGIYMVGDSRVNIAGLNADSVPVLAEAMMEAGL